MRKVSQMTISHTAQEPDAGVRAEVMAHARAIAGEPPTPKLRSLVCPYCGAVTPDSGRCEKCAGRFDPLSRQATQNQMGPWEIRDERVPFRPGCSYATLVRLIEQGAVRGETVLRGPSTRQFWTLARHTPGVANRLGVCHNCQAIVKPDAFSCPSCEASFEVERDRQHMGLGPARPLPGQGLPEVLALHAEPASVPGHSAIASSTIPIAASSPARVHDASVKPVSDEESRKRVEDALRLVRFWRARADHDRKNAWAIIIISSLISIGALSYVVLGSGSGGKTASETGDAVE